MYKRNQRVFVSSMNSIEMNSFCQLFNFSTGILAKNHIYGKEERYYQRYGILNCNGGLIDDKNYSILSIKNNKLNKHLYITCTKLGY